MLRPKTLIPFAGLIVALFISAAPASAWWEATGKQLKGPVTFRNGTAFHNEANSVTCSESKATWSIQSKGQIKIHGKGSQEQTKLGPHLNIQVKTWGTCEENLLSVPYNVSPCELQLVQGKESSTATWGMVTSCSVQTMGCAYEIPAGMEKEPGSNEGVNVGLAEAHLENSGNNQEVTFAFVKELQSLSSSCFKSNKKTEIAFASLELENVKIV